MKPDDLHSLEVLAAIVAGCFALGFWIRQWERAARKWPQVSGTIVDSRTVREAGPNVGGQYMVLPFIEYEFNYKGRPFKSKHWRLANFTIGNSEDADPIVSRFPVGSSVTVYVNERDPMKSVLEYRPSPLCWVPFLLGILFFGIFTLEFLIFIQR